MTDPLLPCPFCGGAKLYEESDLWPLNGKWAGIVGCDTCLFNITTRPTVDTQEEAHEIARAAWNRRAPAVRPAAEVTDDLESALMEACDLLEAEAEMNATDDPVERFSSEFLRAAVVRLRNVISTRRAASADKGATP